MKVNVIDKIAFHQVSLDIKFFRGGWVSSTNLVDLLNTFMRSHSLENPQKGLES